MPNRTIEAANALAWLAAAGADVIVDDRPRNWLAAPPRPAPSPQREPVRAAAGQAAPAAATTRNDPAKRWERKIKNQWQGVLDVTSACFYSSIPAK